MKKKILFIPSWYPTHDNGFFGSNYKYLFIAAQELYDVFFLQGIEKKVNILRGVLNLFIKKNEYFKTISPPQGIGFYYTQIRIPYLMRIIEPMFNKLEHFNYILMSKAYLLELGKLINNGWKPDIMHALSTVHAGIATFYLNRKENIPYVISEHQVFLLQAYTKHKVNLIHKTLIYANLVLPVSEHQRRQILMNYIDCRTKVMGNLIDEELYYIKTREKSKFTILTVTYNSMIKDNNTLFLALKELVDQGIIDVQLIIIGGNFSGQDIPDYENPFYPVLNKLGLLPYVTLKSFVSKEKMVDYYNVSDVFVTTSIAETFGMAQCEAMMCGIPVIATANGGIDDFISSNNGIKIQIGDFLSLAENIIKIKIGELKFNRNDVRNSVLNKYGKESFMKRLNLFYEEV